MNRQTGFALLIVLTTMAFLSLLGTQLLAAARSDTRLADDLRTDAVLEAAADGAVAHVVFAMRAARDPDFRPDGIAREVRIGPTPVIVRVWNESDRVNLNTAPAPLLRALVVGVGAEASVADQVAAAILDWRTKGANPTDGAARTQRYRLAGFSHAPPGTNFKTVLDLNDVLGMTPALFARLAPHVTVWTTDDPDMTTRDPVVKKALAEVSPTADPTAVAPPQSVGEVLRIVATALGKGGARHTVTVVASGDFQRADPHVAILLRVRAGAE